jgi:hypothetical protein
MKKTLSLLIPIIIFPITLYCQEKDTNTIKTTYKFDLTGVVTNVNGTSKTIVNSGAANTVKWKKFESTLGTDYQLLSDNGVNAVNDFTLRVQPRIVEKHYSIFSFGQLSSLESKKITQRFEGGLGGGRTILKTKYLESTLSYAMLYYSNNFQDLTHREGFRHSPRFQTWGKIEDYKINYSFEIFYQPSIDDLNDYILRSKTVLGFDLNKKFMITASYNSWFESYYVIGSRNNVKTFTFGTSYKID